MRFKFNEKRHGEVVSFKGLFGDIISEFNLEKSFTIEVIKTVWIDIVSDILSTHSIPERITKGVLYIAADHSVYANEIIMMKDTIISKIQDSVSEEILTDIRVEVKRLQW